MRFLCPSCGQPYDLGEELDGRRVRCKACGEVFRVEFGVKAPPDPSPGPGADPEGGLYEVAPAPEPPPRPATPPPSAPESGRDWPMGDGRSGAGFPSPPRATRARSVVKGVVLAVVLVVALVAVRAATRSVQVAIEGNDPDEVRRNATYDPFFGEPQAPDPAPRPEVVGAVGEVMQGSVKDMDAVREVFERVRTLADFEREAPTIKGGLDAWAANMGKAPKMTPAEEREVGKAWAPALRESIGGLRREADRVGGIPGVPPSVKAVSGRLGDMADRLKRDLDRPPPVPCVDLIVLDVDGRETAEAVKAELLALVDEPPGKAFVSVSHTNNGRTNAGYRVGPVADPKAFAARLRFATLTQVAPRKYQITRVRLPSETIARAKAQIEEEERKRSQR